MYSHEIAEYIKLRNYIISVYEYSEILKTSPQVNHVLYRDEYFEFGTTDNYNIKFKIKEINFKD